MPDEGPSRVQKKQLAALEAMQVSSCRPHTRALPGACRHPCLCGVTCLLSDWDRSLQAGGMA